MKLLNKQITKKQMYTCTVRAKTLEDLRFLTEIKVAELLAKGKNILRVNGKGSVQRKLFNMVHEPIFESVLICEN